MDTSVRTLTTIGLLLMAAASAPRAQSHAMPPGMTHAEHLAQMKKDAELKRRGAAAMGFDQDKTTHHFLLDAAGGSIDVAANDPADEEARAQIRVHLKAIAADFSHGKFDKPLATHNEQPPGVTTMRARRKAIVYEYLDTPAGGRVRISSRDKKAVSAVHQFLSYQLREHGSS